jgi:hypothetical protein
MPTPTAPTTELEAVNAILATIGEAPINSLNQPGLADATLAYSLLGNVSREVQMRGWAFNSENNFPITPDVQGNINLPPNILQVRIADSQISQYDGVQRGQRLYDRRRHTFSYPLTVKVNIVIALTFEDMPQAARWYITMRAARMFLDRSVGNADLHGFDAKDEEMALAELQTQESETGSYNMLYDNYSVFRIVDRGNSIYGGETTS